MVGIGEFNERDAKSGCVETGEGVADAFGAHSASDEGNGPVSGESIGRDGVTYGQEAAIEAGIGPVALHGEASGFAVREQSNALSTGEAHRGGDGEVTGGLHISGPRAKELELELLCGICAEGEVFGCLRWR